MRYLRRRADAAAAWVWEGEPGGVEMHLAEVVAGVGLGLRLEVVAGAGAWAKAEAED